MGCEFMWVSSRLRQRDLMHFTSKNSSFGAVKMWPMLSGKDGLLKIDNCFSWLELIAPIGMVSCTRNDTSTGHAIKAFTWIPVAGGLRLNAKDGTNGQAFQKPEICISYRLPRESRSLKGMATMIRRQYNVKADASFMSAWSLGFKVTSNKEHAYTHPNKYACDKGCFWQNSNAWPAFERSGIILPICLIVSHAGPKLSVLQAMRPCPFVLSCILVTRRQKDRRLTVIGSSAHVMSKCSSSRWGISRISWRTGPVAFTNSRYTLDNLGCLRRLLKWTFKFLILQSLSSSRSLKFSIEVKKAKNLRWHERSQDKFSSLQKLIGDNKVDAPETKSGSRCRDGLHQIRPDKHMPQWQAIYPPLSSAASDKGFKNA